MYEMKDEYLTGIEFIDNEHRRLFEIAEETYQLKNAEFIPDKYDQINDLLNELKESCIFPMRKSICNLSGIRSCLRRRHSIRPLSTG